MNRLVSFVTLGSLMLIGACASSGGAGGAVALDDADRAAQQAIGAKLKAQVVWSSARLGNHDLFLRFGEVPRAELAARVAHFSLSAQPGSFSHSNVGYSLAACVMEWCGVA